MAASFAWCLALILAGWALGGAPARADWVSAGPIWNNMDAQGKCPRVCGGPGRWDGNWRTVAPGRSTCDCRVGR
ncbi:mannan-binding protein [Xanthobacter sediminis]